MAELNPKIKDALLKSHFVERYEKLRELSDEDLEKVSLFIGWITKA